MKIKSFLWILLFGVFCSNSMAELPKVIAHRGYWKTPSSAQNSLRALELADSIGVYGSEFDVWLTKDDVLIVRRFTTGQQWEQAWCLMHCLSILIMLAKPG